MKNRIAALAAAASLLAGIAVAAGPAYASGSGGGSSGGGGTAGGGGGTSGGGAAKDPAQPPPASPTPPPSGGGVKQPCLALSAVPTAGQSAANTSATISVRIAEALCGSGGGSQIETTTMQLVAPDGTVVGSATSPLEGVGSNGVSFVFGPFDGLQFATTYAMQIRVVNKTTGLTDAQQNDPAETPDSRVPGSFTIDSFQVFPDQQNYYGPPTNVIEIATNYTNHGEGDDVDVEVQTEDQESGEVDSDTVPITNEFIAGGASVGATNALQGVTVMWPNSHPQIVTMTLVEASTGQRLASETAEVSPA